MRNTKLKPLYESIKEEYEEFKPVVVPSLNKILEKYGLLDVLHTAKLFYERSGEKSAAKICDDAISKTKIAFRNG